MVLGSLSEINISSKIEPLDAIYKVKGSGMLQESKKANKRDANRDHKSITD